MVRTLHFVRKPIAIVLAALAVAVAAAPAAAEDPGVQVLSSDTRLLDDGGGARASATRTGGTPWSNATLAMVAASPQQVPAATRRRMAFEVSLRLGEVTPGSAARERAAPPM